SFTPPMIGASEASIRSWFLAGGASGPGDCPVRAVARPGWGAERRDRCFRACWRRTVIAETWLAGGWSGECDAQPAEAFGDLGGPPPGAVDAQAGAAGGAGELGGHMQDPVAEGGDLAAGQRRHVREADQLGPADQVGGGEHGLQPGTVLRPAPAREPAQPGLLAFADAVLDPGVLAVPQLQPGGLAGDHTAAGVGE